MIGVPQALVSDAGPTHGAPQELPRIQVRVLVWVPAPHLTEHALNPLKPDHLELMIGVPQARVSVNAPTHGLPHRLPAIQARVLVWVPAPHFTEHALNAPKPVNLE